MILEGLPTQLTNMANAFHSLVCFFLILKMYSSDLMDFNLSILLNIAIVYVYESESCWINIYHEECVFWYLAAFFTGTEILSILSKFSIEGSCILVHLKNKRVDDEYIPNVCKVMQITTFTTMWQ